MKLHVILSNDSIRFYGDRDFFAHLACEALRISKSSIGDYSEFQTIELLESREAGVPAIEYRVFRSNDLLDMNSYQAEDEKDFDCVFMAIEDHDFRKHGSSEK